MLERRQRVFEHPLVRTIERIREDVEARAEKLVCGCNGKLLRNGTDKRKVQTLLGEIEFERTRFRCQGCGKNYYPLDLALGLEPQMKATIGVMERSLWACVEVSYEKSKQFLEKFTGLEVSRGTIHNMAIEEGRRIEQWEEQRRKEVFEQAKGVKEPEGKAPDVMYVQVDATGVNNRASKKWMECKVGASFSQRAYISKNRFLLVDKRSYAGIEDVDAFGEKFFLDCVKQGVLNAKKIIFIGDGASWIKRLKEDYFPSSIGVLDIWHLERQLKDALGEKRKKIVKGCIGLALMGKGEEIIKRLKRVFLRVKEEKEREKLLGAIAYVEGNLEGIGNIPLVDGYGSGSVEKTVDITVCRRFKKRGMSWYSGGANPLLKLRLLKLNGEWDEYWKKRKEELSRLAA